MSRLEILVLSLGSYIQHRLIPDDIMYDIFGICFGIIYAIMLFKDKEYVGRKGT